MSYLSEFLLVALVHFLAVISPGPDFAVIIRQSLRYGRAIAISTAVGIGAGLSVHIIYSLLGVSALMLTLPWLLIVAKIIGAGYLIYLGILFIKSQPKGTLDIEHNGKNKPTNGYKAFMLGFFTNATNPKATLFFLSLFTSLINPKTPLLIQAGYGLWMIIITALWFSLVSIMFTQERLRNRFMRISHWIERATGGILLVLAAALLVSAFITESPAVAG